MALSKTDIMDLMVEEKQILNTLEQATNARDAAKQAAEQAYVVALNSADSVYQKSTEAAESRLIELRQSLKVDGTWTPPNKAKASK